MEYIKLNHITKRYDRFALGPVDISLFKGQVTGLVGETGAGKTTLIRIIAGLIHPDEGTIHVAGQKITAGQYRNFYNHTAFVLDGDYYYPEFTLKQMARIAAHGYRNWNAAAFQNYISRYQLPQNDKIGTFSKGMKIKLSLAFAFSHRAECVIMDEPTSGLDPKARRYFIDEITSFAKAGNAVLLSTHITSDLDKAADRLILLSDGSVCLDDSMQHIRDICCIVETTEAPMEDAIISKKADQVSGSGYVSMIRKEELNATGIRTLQMKVRETDVETLMFLHCK